MVGGRGADTWSSPCGGAPSITQPTALFLTPPPYPLAMTAVRWGCRERPGNSHPLVSLDYVITHKSELTPAGEPEAKGFPTSPSPSCPSLCCS